MATFGMLGHQGHGKTTLAAALGAHGAPFAVSDPVDWTQAAGWAGAILVVNVADGPMPGTRNDVMTATRQGVRGLVVFLNQLDLVEESEIVDLVEMEVRELCQKHGPGEVAVVRGSALRAAAGDRSAIGAPAVAQLIGAVAALGG